VTIVITDVEGSTELWEWDGGVMDAAQEIHDSLMRDLISKWVTAHSGSRVGLSKGRRRIEKSESGDAPHETAGRAPKGAAASRARAGLACPT
jgi:hypothetical protein